MKGYLSFFDGMMKLLLKIVRGKVLKGKKLKRGRKDWDLRNGKKNP